MQTLIPLHDPELSSKHKKQSAPGRDSLNFKKRLNPMSRKVEMFFVGVLYKIVKVLDVKNQKGSLKGCSLGPRGQWPVDR